MGLASKRKLRSITTTEETSGMKKMKKTEEKTKTMTKMALFG